jgi:hypothetical protein
MRRPGAVILLLLLCFVPASAQPAANIDFLGYVAGKTSPAAGSADDSASKTSAIDRICPISQSLVARRVLAEYGAMFAAAEPVRTPPNCIFADEIEVAAFHKSLDILSLNVDGTIITLQRPAAVSLGKILVAAADADLRIKPLDGTIAGGRTYSDTMRLWHSRFDPALRYWTGRRRISMEDAAAIGPMTLEQQIEKVIEWESQGMYFGTGRARSIFSSTAPPGTSQHLSLIALDLRPPITPALIELMKANGWYQTVVGDTPHFTYLGVPERELPGRGLKAIVVGGTQYWVPNILSNRQD